MHPRSLKEGQMPDNNPVPVDTNLKAAFQKADEAFKSAIAAVRKMKADVNAHDALAEALDKALV